MAAQEFRAAPQGPKIGPVRDYTELSEAERAELGILDDVTVEAEPEALEIPADTAEQLDVLRQLNAADKPPERITVAEADLQEFYRCILGEQRFVKTYKLFAGAVEVTICDLSPQEVDHLYVRAAAQAAKNPDMTQADWDLLLERLQAIARIQSLRVGDATVDIGDSVDTLLAAFSSDTVYRAVVRKVGEFQQLMDALFERAGDANFLQADGRSSQSEPTSAAQ